MIKIDKFSFKSLRKLTVGERLNAVKNPEIGFSLMSALTPTQIAELFPRYYLMREPDISGFLKAVPSNVQAARQQYYDEQLQNTVSGAKEGAAPIQPTGKKSWWDKVKDTVSGGTARVMKPGEAPKYKLTPEQTATYDLLKSGQNIEANDPRTKFMATLTPEQMKAVGLEKIKSEDGKEMFHFNPEAFKATEEEAKKSLVASGNRSPRENAVLDMIAKREGAKDPNTIFGGEKYKAAVGYTKPLTQMSISEVLEMQKKMTQVTAAAGVAGGRGTSAVGSGQFIRGTLIENLDRLHIPRADWDNIKFDHDLQKRVTLENFRHYVGDPNGDPDRWNKYTLGKQWESFDTSKNFPELKNSEIQTVREASPEKPNIGGDYSQQAIAARLRQMESERSTAAVGKLAEYTGAQMGAPGAPGVSATAQNEGTKKLNEITSYHSAGKGYCGIGTRLAARDLFGDKYFAEGLSKGGSAQASSLSRDNNYFQGSGYYNAKQDIEKEKATDPKYLNSLPIGTVMSAQGGNVHGDGHVQIKLGPNKWVSYFDQSGVLAQRADGRQYHGYSVHIPNEKGLARINERGFATTVAAPEGQQPTGPVVEDAHDVSHSEKGADRKLDEPTSEIDAQGRPRAPGQAPLTPSDEAAHAGVTIRRKDDPSNVPQYEPGPPSTQAPQVKGLDGATQPTPTAPPPGEAPVVAPKVVPKGTQTSAAGPKETVFTLNKDAYISEVAKKHPVIDGPFAGMGPVPDRAGVWKQTVDGFKEAEAKGILKFDQKTGRITIKDMNHPEVQKILKDMKDNDLDRSVFLKQHEEPKPKAEAPKPEVKPVEQPQQGLEKYMEQPAAPAATAPQAKVEPPTVKQFVKGEGYAGLKDVPNPNYVPSKTATVTQTGAPSATVTSPATQTGTPAPKPEEKKDGTPAPTQVASNTPAPTAQPVPKAEPPKPEPKTDTPKVEVKATGGTAPADSQIQAYPIGGLRGDNSVVVDAQQQPLFTMNTKTEALLPNPQENRVDVVPTQKQTNSANEQAPNPMQKFSDDLENVRQEIQTTFSDMSINNNVTGKTARNPVTDRDSHMIDGLLDSTRTAYKNPTSQRAFNRSRFHETGDPTNDFHHSIGNTA